MRRRSILAVAGWLATAVVATLIGLAAIRLVGESITGTPGGVLSQREVERLLAAEPTSPGPTTAAPGPSGATPSAPAAGRRVFTTAGGTAVAECVPGGVRLVSWSPAQGYRAGDVDRGPDDDVEVKFEGPSGEHELKVRCVGREPVAVPDD
ncbi:hypothetical protein GA0070609_4701 [Micromonospora echinaurantiaca]|uniref:Septum formation initiator n=1 Tax=Micromonospora echinaurantiaca TaxID=47857 RepID=A0A1C5JPZ6_9ACTN|nr:septum formation initiator [Micromonospora echinaurantiaca]SCG72411.1 hypothetical protein GA0070609_4701 [Micromonospora echinaurantiaca]